MVNTVDSEEEHPGVIPSSSTADGGSSVSREEFNAALDTLKTSMMTEVEGMFNKFLEGLKLSLVEKGSNVKHISAGLLLSRH